MPNNTPEKAKMTVEEESCCGKPMKRTKVGWYCKNCEDRVMEPPNVLVELVMGDGGAQAILLNGYRLTSMKVSPSQTIKDWLIEVDDILSLPCVQEVLRSRDQLHQEHIDKLLGSVRIAKLQGGNDEYADGKVAGNNAAHEALNSANEAFKRTH